jgi:hypothetical protein
MSQLRGEVEDPRLKVASLHESLASTITKSAMKQIMFIINLSFHSLCCPLFARQIVGDPLPPGAVAEKESVKQSPIEFPNQEIH